VAEWHVPRPQIERMVPNFDRVLDRYLHHVGKKTGLKDIFAELEASPSEKRTSREGEERREGKGGWEGQEICYLSTERHLSSHSESTTPHKKKTRLSRSKVGIF
jgi:hypothetical protein